MHLRPAELKPEGRKYSISGVSSKKKKEQLNWRLLYITSTDILFIKYKSLNYYPRFLIK